MTPEEQQQIEQLELQIAWIKEKFPLQQQSIDGKWYDCVIWAYGYTYRRKPSKKIVPLEASDIDLHRDLFHEMDASFVFLAEGRSGEAVMINRMCKTYECLMKFWHRSTDGGKTWLPCSKEVES